MIKLEKKDIDFENARFCTIARGEKKRFDLHYLKVEAGICTGIGNTRLHEAFVETLQDGFYEVVKCNKSLLWLDQVEGKVSWPSKEGMEQVWPNLRKCKYIPASSCRTREAFLLYLASIIRALPESRSIEPNYVEDLGPGFEVYVPVRGNFPICFANSDKWAAIMPSEI